MGRLFDAVAAICGLPPVISFEGQAAMALEFAADENESGAYPLVVDCSPDGNGAGVSPAAVQPGRPADADRLGAAGALPCWPIGPPACRWAASRARFHNALAEMAVAIARAVARLAGRSCSPAAAFKMPCWPSGVRARLSAAGFQVYTHHQVPPGDGGIALGQVSRRPATTGKDRVDVSGNSR